MAILGLDTFQKQAIFFGYMALWSGLRMLTFASKQEKYGAPQYNETSLLVFVCFAKLCMAIGMYLQADGGLQEYVRECSANKALFLRYSLPALSYVVYDNLTFINLTHTDPVTYVILMQLRIVATGVVWSIFFGKPLIRNQWLGIAMITSACVLQKLPALMNSSSSDSSVLFSIALIGIQIACGVFSSVFNEVLLKEKGGAGVNIQNSFMYVWSIICNVAWLCICPSKAWCKSDIYEALQYEHLTELLHYLVLPIGVMLACIGIVTSLFIKNLDSVRKTIASAIEIFVDALLALVIFQVPITQYTVMACILAGFGVVQYSKPAEVQPLV